MSERVIKVKWSKLISYKEKEKASIPEQSGVYEYYDQVDNKPRRAYVGKAENLKSRFQEHLSNTENNECLKKLLQTKYIWYYRYALISKKDDREDAELGLYQKYKPKRLYRCNTNVPPGSGKGKFKIEES